jgi:excisionase family DNA binding protein
MGKRYLTIKKAAEYLGVSPLTLRNWDKKGKLVAARNPINNYRAYSVSDLEDFLKRIEGRKPRKLHVKFIED